MGRGDRNIAQYKVKCTVPMTYTLFYIAIFLIYHSTIALQNDTLIDNISVNFLITLQNEDFKVKQS